MNNSDPHNRVFLPFSERKTADKAVWKNVNFVTFLNRRLYSLKKINFPSRLPERLVFRPMLPSKIKQMKRLQTFNQNHGLNPVEKWHLRDFPISMFLSV